ncbi:hypothetical protein ACIQ7D_25720 [Streptomyces sp. NPDC096310]|uniref:hypothetical protein n=1 Tax=Streptomyces sp. NPDC096310 TaxID=3366082 RepID=UPI0038082876
MATGAATAGLLTAACSSSDPAGGQVSGGPDGAAARAAHVEKALRRRSAETNRALLARYDAVRERHPGQEARLAPLRAAVARQITVLTPEAGKEEAPKASSAPYGAEDGASGDAAGGAARGAVSGTERGAARAPEKPSATSGSPDSRDLSDSSGASDSPSSPGSPGSSARAGAPGSSATPASTTTADATVTAVPHVSADSTAALKELAAAELRTCDAHTATLMEAPPELARLLASLAAASAGHAYLLTEGARP